MLQVLLNLIGITCKVPIHNKPLWGRHLEQFISPSHRANLAKSGSRCRSRQISGRVKAADRVSMYDRMFTRHKMSPLSLCTSVHRRQGELLTGWRSRGNGLNLQNFSPFQTGGEAHHRMGDQEGLVGILAHGTLRRPEPHLLPCTRNPCNPKHLAKFSELFCNCGWK